MGKYLGLFTLVSSIGMIIFGWIGWFLNLAHCIAYIGGGNADDSTAEIAVRIVGIFTWLPGAIAGWL